MSLPIDPYLAQILEGYTDNEVTEIYNYLYDWDAGTYSSVAHSVLDHAQRKGFTLLRYLAKPTISTEKVLLEFHARAIVRMVLRFTEKVQNF